MLRENRILEVLSGFERDAFLDSAQRVELKVHDVIAVPEERFTVVYFPIDCVLSTTIVTEEGDEVEIATIGLEGFDPVAVLLGAESSPYRTVCQVAGGAYRLPLDVFIEAIESSPSLRSQASRFGQAFMQFMAQSIACNRLHPLVERCARWLLMTHDRVSGDDFRLTQEYLAVMLGVRRPAVSGAAQALAREGLITYTRGSITILDREGLERHSCECYATIADVYERMLTPPVVPVAR